MVAQYQPPARAQLAQAMGNDPALVRRIEDLFRQSESATPTDIADIRTHLSAIENMVNAGFKGALSIGPTVDLTSTQATTLLNIFTDALKGLVPASGGGTATFLRADGTWSAPPIAADGDKGDIIVSGSGTVWSLDYTAVNASVAPVWAAITAKPTTVAGYGITDGVTLTGTQTLTGKGIDGLTNTITSLDLTMMLGTGLIQPVKVVALTNINLAAGGLLTIDGIALGALDRALVAGQTIPAENGVYLVGPGAWSRVTDANTVQNLAGATVMVRRGTVYQGTQWVTNFPGNGVVGTTAMPWFRCLNNGSPLAWTSVTGAPVTVAGYGISDAVTLTGAQTITNKSIAATQLTGTIPVAAEPAYTGDVTSSAGSSVNTLATVNGNIGSWGLAASVAQFTVNAKGLITAAANVAISIASAAISDATTAGKAMLTAASASAQAALLNSVIAPIWANITSTPTTIAGYGITDGVTLTGVQTLTNKTMTGANTTLTGFDMSIMSGAGFVQSIHAVSNTNVVIATGGLITVDGTFVTFAGARILLVNQTTPSENGIYLASSGPWSRAPDQSVMADIATAIVTVKRGATFVGTQWANTNASTSVLGTTALTWARLLRSDSPIDGVTVGAITPDTVRGTALTSTGTITDGVSALAAGTLALAFGSKGVATVTPNATASFTTTVPAAGTRCTLIITTSGVTSFTMTFGTGFKTTGTLATGTATAKVFTLQFISDGTSVIECSRTVAM